MGAQLAACVFSRSAYLAQICLSYSICRNTPPTTGRAVKPRLLRRVGEVPVGHRDPVRRFVQEREHGIDQGLEVSRSWVKRGRPEDPVQFGVGLAIVQRQAVLVLHLPIVVPSPSA